MNKSRKQKFGQFLTSGEAFEVYSDLLRFYGVSAFALIQKETHYK